MTNYHFSDDQLKQASRAGEKQAARSLSVLAKRQVNVETVEAKLEKTFNTAEIFANIEEHSVIAYSQALTGLTGVSLLSMDRQDALNLVDLFNQRVLGTTKVMQEIDRSTVKETLNILANSYIVELVKISNTTIMLSVPTMVTKNQLASVAEKATATNQEAIIFKTKLNVSGDNFQISLHFFFLTGNKEGVKT